MKITLFVLFCCLIQSAKTKCWAAAPTDSLEIIYDELGLSNKLNAPHGINSFPEQVALIDGFAVRATRHYTTELFLHYMQSQLKDLSWERIRPSYDWRVTNRKPTHSGVCIAVTKKNPRSGFFQIQMIDPIPRVVQHRITALNPLLELRFLLKIFVLVDLFERIFEEIPQSLYQKNNLKISYRVTKFALNYNF